MTSYPELDPYLHLFGKVPDEVIAAQAGVSASKVARARRRLSIKQVELVVEAPAPAAPAAEAPAPAPEAAPAAADEPAAEGRSKLTAFAHLVGVESDRTVANLAGVSVEAVRMYRKRRGIPAAALAQAAPPSEPEAAAAPEAAAPAVVEAAPAVEAAPVVEAAPAAPAAEVADRPGRRRSRLDPYIDLVGKVPDAELALKAGVTPENVRAFRNRHGIGAYYRQPGADGSAPTAPRRGRPPKVRPVDAAPAAAPAPRPAPAARVSGAREAWSVRSSSGAVYVVLAAGFSAAAAEASARLGAAEPDASVVGIERVGVALA